MEDIIGKLLSELADLRTASGDNPLTAPATHYAARLIESLGTVFIDVRGISVNGPFALTGRWFDDGDGSAEFEAILWDEPREVGDYDGWHVC